MGTTLSRAKSGPPSSRLTKHRRREPTAARKPVRTAQCRAPRNAVRSFTYVTIVRGGAARVTRHVVIVDDQELNLSLFCYRLSFDD